MPLQLTVDGERWRAHLRRIGDGLPGLVPVAKGNGYGFGLGRLARKADWLGVEALAVGTYEELPQVADRYAGDLLVLTPWRQFADPGTLAAKHAHRVIHTVGRLEDLEQLLERQPSARLVLERLTSMRRHGLSAADLRTAIQRVSGHPHARLEGVAAHLPITQGAHLAEVERVLEEAGPGIGQVWVSHLTGDELTSLSAAHPDLRVRPRIGTDLWLGDRGALVVTSTVLDVHPIRKGEAFGYRGRAAPKEGHLLVVSGGTAHGIGLESPMSGSGLRDRAATVARGGLDAVGRVRSPFWVGGEQRLFAEPPHMQASMLFLPADAGVPAVGDLVDARVRYTATTFDRVELT
ncbi:alanine racemase [Nocardioides sp.]|uniref:alanine racemase n=1 Tax=Nocardioides sp. TaxID=35761 RepID=UPI001A2419AC|nr:alanine racemase [Nocardioides sp.]MBJ7359422.1 alanine racemase [Nocardioides sp.]